MNYAITLTMLLSPLPFSETAAELDAESRARAALALAAAGAVHVVEYVPVVPPPKAATTPHHLLESSAADYAKREHETYCRMYRRALAEGKPLIIQVCASGGRTDIVDDFDDCLHVRLTSMQGVSGDNIVVTRPIAGSIYKIATLPIKAALGTLRALVSGLQPSASLVQGTPAPQYYRGLEPLAGWAAYGRADPPKLMMFGSQSYVAPQRVQSYQPMAMGNGYRFSQPAPAFGMGYQPFPAPRLFSSGRMMGSGGGLRGGACAGGG